MFGKIDAKFPVGYFSTAITEPILKEINVDRTNLRILSQK